jgi:hypothetical protein
LDDRVGDGSYTPLTHAAAMASLALLLPWSMVIQRWLYGVPGASLHSVFSRFRFARALLLVGPVWVAMLFSAGSSSGSPAAGPEAADRVSSSACS